MLEIVLLIALGFLLAALLGFIVAPSIYRRIVKLTERRMRATVPLSAEEIKAEKDMQRAAFAAENARVTVDLRKERTLLTEEKATTSKLAATIAKMRGQNSDLEILVADLKTSSGELRTKLRLEEKELAETKLRLKEANDANIQKEQQITALIDKANRLSADIDEQKINLASTTTEAESLKSSLETLSAAHEKLQNEQSELEIRAADIEDQLKVEKSRAEHLEAKLESSDKKLEKSAAVIKKRDEDIVQFKETISKVKLESAELKKAFNKSETERKQLERKLVKLEKDLQNAKATKPSSTQAQNQAQDKAKTGGAKAAQTTKPAVKTTSAQKLTKQIPAAEIAKRVDMLRKRHNALVDELNKKVTATSDQEMRKELAEIAAMMIDLTAAREGQESEAVKALGQPKPLKPGAKPSLADRAARRVNKTYQQDTTPPVK